MYTVAQTMPPYKHTLYLGTGLFVKNTASDIVLFKLNKLALFISHVVIKTGLSVPYPSKQRKKVF